MRGDLDVSDDLPSLADRVATFIVETMISTPGVFRISLSGGSTPKPLYQRLAQPDMIERIPWNRVHWYFGDERFVPPDHPDSNFGMVRDALFSKVPAPAETIHRIPTEKTPAQAADLYEATLKAAYGNLELDPGRPLFSLSLLGLGDDGHFASLLPGAAALDERKRWVMAVEHGRPEARITLTYPAIESSQVTVFMISGTEKADIMRTVRIGKSEHPAARLRPQAKLIWFADRAAAGA